MKVLSHLHELESEVYKLEADEQGEQLEYGSITRKDNLTQRLPCLYFM